MKSIEQNPLVFNQPLDNQENTITLRGLEHLDKEEQIQISVKKALTGLEEFGEKIRRRFVKLNVGNQVIFTNINSIAHHLEISRKDVLKAAKDGKLEKLIQESLDYYKQYQENHSSEQSKIPSNAILKAISAGVNLPFENDHIMITGYKDKSRELCVLRKGESIEIYDFSAKLLGSGTFGNVEAIKEVFSDKVLAFKTPKQKNFAKVIKAGVDNLTFLQSKDTPVPGIQFKPIEVSYKGSIGSMMEMYDKSYFSLIQSRNLTDVELETKLNEGLQLLFALRYLHQNGAIHRDIKPQNILFKEDEHLVHLSDFDGLKRIEKSNRELSSRELIGKVVNESQTTKYYKPRRDLEFYETMAKRIILSENKISSLKEFIENPQKIKTVDTKGRRELRRWQIYNAAIAQNVPRLKELLDEVEKDLKVQKKQLIERAYKMDVYAMGVTLWKSFYGQDPYLEYDDQSPDHSKSPFLVVRDKELPEMTDLIKRMIDPDANKRPMPEEIYLEWCRIINHQDGMESLQQKIVQWEKQN